MYHYPEPIDVCRGIKQAEKQWPDELKIHLLNMCRLRVGMIQHMVDAEGTPQCAVRPHRQTGFTHVVAGPEGSARVKCCRDTARWGQVLAKDKFTLKEAAMTARRFRNGRLITALSLNLGRGDTMKAENSIRFCCAAGANRWQTD